MSMDAFERSLLQDAAALPVPFLLNLRRARERCWRRPPLCLFHSVGWTTDSMLRRPLREVSRCCSCPPARRVPPRRSLGALRRPPGTPLRMNRQAPRASSAAAGRRHPHASFILWWAAWSTIPRVPFLRAGARRPSARARRRGVFARPLLPGARKPSTARWTPTADADADCDRSGRSSVSSEAAAAAKALRSLASAWTAKFGRDWHGDQRPGAAVDGTTDHSGGEARRALLEYVEASATSAALSATLFEATYYISEEGGGLLWAPILAS